MEMRSLKRVRKVKKKTDVKMVQSQNQDTRKQKTMERE